MWTFAWNALDRLFFGAASASAGALGRLLRVLRYPYAVARDLARGEINLRAMSLVFTTLLSLIPLLAFSFAILKAFGADRNLEPIVFEFFRPVGASAAQLTARVMQFADRVSSGLVGSLGFVLLAWTLLETLKKVEDSFNFLWRVEHPRSLVRRVSEYLAMLIIGPLLVGGFLGLMHAALQSEPVQLLQNVPPLRRALQAALRLAPYAMVTVLFTVLYMLIPNTRVRLKPALAGALCAGVAWAAIGKMFTGMVVSSTRLLIVYAGFAVIVAVLTWTYFGWLILLAGTRLSFYVQNPSDLRLGLTELRLSGVEQEQLSLRLMFLVGRSQLRGGRPWRIDALAAELAVPGVAVAQSAAALECAGLLAINARDELLPGREVASIAVREILEVARSQGSGHQMGRATPLPALEQLGARLEQAWRECCGTRTLRDLIEEA